MHSHAHDGRGGRFTHTKTLANTRTHIHANAHTQTHTRMLLHGETNKHTNAHRLAHLDEGTIASKVRVLVVTEHLNLPLP